MPNLLDLRRRLRSVKSTQQVTKAMKMVSAAKLRRAQDRILSARPFAIRMLEVLNSLATRADPQGASSVARARAPAGRGNRHYRGQRAAGAFSANILKEAVSFLEKTRAEELELQVIGRKARDFFRRRSYTIRAEHVGIFRELTYDDAKQGARPIMDRYMEGSLDAVYLIYNQFKNVLQQDVVVERLLPLEKLHFDLPEEQFDYIYEPARRRSSKTSCRSTWSISYGARCWSPRPQSMPLG